MRISEKSLELNIGAEVLDHMRRMPGLERVYLRGLTQKEESQEGVDFFLQLNPEARLWALQFKAPNQQADGEIYRFRLKRDQHSRLFELAELQASSVFYVFPFFARFEKLQHMVPALSADTWLLDIGRMPPEIFGECQSRSVECSQGLARINPEYEILPLRKAGVGSGIPVREFAEWYADFRKERVAKGTRNPWLTRGLRVMISVPP